MHSLNSFSFPPISLSSAVQRSRKASTRLKKFVNLALTAEPFNVAALGTLGHLSRQLNRLRLVAGFAVVLTGTNNFDFDRDDIPPPGDQARATQSFAFDLH